MAKHLQRFCGDLGDCEAYLLQERQFGMSFYAYKLCPSLLFNHPPAAPFCPSLRYVPGVTPISRLNAFLNEASDS